MNPNSIICSPTSSLSFLLLLFFWGRSWVLGGGGASTSPPIDRTLLTHRWYYRLRSPHAWLLKDSRLISGHGHAWLVIPIGWSHPPWIRKWSENVESWLISRFQIEIPSKISGFQQRFLEISPKGVRDFYEYQTLRILFIRYAIINIIIIIAYCNYRIAGNFRGY